MHIQNEENMQTTTTICLSIYIHEETNNNISTLLSQVSKRFPLIFPSGTVHAWEIFCSKTERLKAKTEQSQKVKSSCARCDSIVLTSFHCIGTT